MLTSTVTLDPLELPETCDAVYLLDDAVVPALATLVYEATLNGVAWSQVTPGQITSLGHSGTTMQVRATLTLDETSEDPVRINWFIAYGTTGA